MSPGAGPRGGLKLEPFAELKLGEQPYMFSPGDIVAGRFKVVRFIGCGGMGEVYESEDLDLGTRVALKTIRQEISSDQRTLVRFKQEIELARRVTHRNVCRVFDLERHQPPPRSGRPEVAFLTMELLEGETLSSRLRREKRLRPEDALPLIHQVAEGLAAAHRAGVIHRDFKPGNVILVADLDSGNFSPPFYEQETQSSSRTAARRGVAFGVRAVITDFGLAQPAAPAPPVGATTPSLTGEAVGTPRYMAPEQSRGGEITPATDVYALGLVIHEILTGQLPLPTATHPKGSSDGSAAPTVPLLAPEVDSGLMSIIVRCLEKEPSGRYAHAGEVVEALDQLAESAGGAAATEAGRRRRRARRVRSVVLAGALAGLALFGFWLSRRPPPITTSSRIALGRYRQAADLYGKGDLQGSINLAQSALGIDPGFALAHLLLATDYDELGDDPNARRELDTARHEVNHVTERERYLIQAYEDYYENVFQKALEEYRAVLQLYPKDPDALRGVARTATWMGQTDAAFDAERKLVQQGRHYEQDYKQLMHLLIDRNRFREALDVYRDAQQHSASISGLHWPASLAYWGEDDLASAQRELELLRKGGATREANLAALYSARMLQYQGRLSEADGALRAGLILDEEQHSETWVPLRLYLLVKGDVAMGRTEQAEADDDRLVATASWGAEDFQRAGLVGLQIGRLDKARGFLASLDEIRSSRNSVFTQSDYYNLEGEAHAAEGRLDQAAASERQALLLLPSYAPYMSLGKISAMSEDWPSAVEAYQKYLSLKGQVLEYDCPIDWAAAQLQVARAYVKLGDRTRAERYYDSFLSLWAKGDASLPLLVAARQERQTLEQGN